jgi:hypothetical protein
MKPTALVRSGCAIIGIGSSGDLNRVRAYAAELVKLAPDVLLANSTPVMTALLSPLSRSYREEPDGSAYSKDDFRQLVIAIETPPAFFGGLSELEDHRQRGLVRETSLGSHGAGFNVSHVANRGGCRLNRD